MTDFEYLEEIVSEQDEASAYKAQVLLDFEVTTDYLMGSSNIRNPDQYFQALDRTKLSDKAIRTLLDYPETLPFINSFLEKTELIREMAIRFDEISRRLEDYIQFKEAYDQRLIELASDDPDLLLHFKVGLEGERRNYIKNFEIEEFRLRKCFEQFTSDVINSATKPQEDEIMKK